MDKAKVIGLINEFQSAVINDIFHEVADEVLQERLISLVKEDGDNIRLALNKPQ